MSLRGTQLHLLHPSAINALFRGSRVDPQRW